MKLERMSDFFGSRLNGYDEHMLSEIKGAKEFYPYTAALLPMEQGKKVLDLGCGTGLELEYYFALNGSASVVGIDLSAEMLNVLKEKLKGRKIKLINASYFDVPFGENEYTAAVSVESLHHFTAVEKQKLYERVCAALTKNGYFILTDYFAESEAAERFYFSELERLKSEQKLEQNEHYHYDTPLTVEHESKVLEKAGFSDVQIMKKWENTYTLLARR